MGDQSNTVTGNVHADGNNFVLAKNGCPVDPIV